MILPALAPKLGHDAIPLHHLVFQPPHDVCCHDLLLQGFTVSQVVHDYGDVCQSITDLAVEVNAPISTDDFRMLNRCL
jgi:hypothetical protein